MLFTQTNFDSTGLQLKPDDFEGPKHLPILQWSTFDQGKISQSPKGFFLNGVRSYERNESKK